MAETKSTIQLDPPGAGLPSLELALSRIITSVARRLISRERAREWFRAEGDRILGLARSVVPAAGMERVLIPRVWGIEDSSRYWSVFMALDHLVITNNTVADIVEHLARGKQFGREVSIAAVKPNPGQSPEVIERFSKSVQNYLARTAALPRLRSEVTHAHPWFGPLDGHGWHCLAAFHQTIHRRQIQRIMTRLANHRG